MPTAPKDNPITARLNAKGYDFIILPPESDGGAPDVHGIPKGYTAYGRCGVYRDGQLFMIVGTQGSSEGHPSNLKWGGYWAAKPVVNKQGKTINVIEVRGRAGVSDDEIYKVAGPICEWISKKIPKV